MVDIDIRQVRSNAIAIRERTGVALLGVVKADAYGLGMRPVATALADLVEAWYVFDAAEAVLGRLWSLTGKPTLCAVVDETLSFDVLAEHRVRPGVWTAEQARKWARLNPVLSVDTGMQRFACPAEQLDRVRSEYAFSEAYTHAARPEQAHRLRELLGLCGMKLHAAGTALLDQPDCQLDAVRPGLALYADAVRVSLPLVDARDSVGPVGYSGFASQRHGVVLRGYSNGMRRGICLVNGRRQRILEVGMQSAYVSLDPADRTGDEVVLLGDGLSLAEAAKACDASPHETLVRLASLGDRSYRT